MKDNVAADAPEEFEDPLSNYDSVQYESDLQRSLAEESIDTIEIQPYLQIHPSSTVRQAVEVLHRTRVSSLLVVEDGRLVGIFTERDVLEKVAESYSELSDVAISNVMTRNPTVVYVTDPVATAIAAIAIAGHRHVPVLSLGDAVCGIVSPHRVFNFIERYFIK